MKSCVVVTENNIRRAVSIVEKFSLAEIRLDLCEFRSQHLREVFSLPTETIATFRESDSSKASTQKIEQLKKSLEYGANYIDIELELNASQREDLLLHAKGYGAKIIVSHHNFEKTPSIDDLKEKISEARSLGADIVKIVTKVNFRDDCLKLFSLYKAEENLIAFGMGEEAKFTRVTSLFLGAPFTYVYYVLGSKTADGQLSYKEFDSIMKAIL